MDRTERCVGKWTKMDSKKGANDLLLTEIGERLHEQLDAELEEAIEQLDGDLTDLTVESGDLDSDEAEALAALQSILLSSDRSQVEELSATVLELKKQINDKGALAETVAPILGDAIRKQISESQDEMVDALYPIIGQLVMRAVTEAIRDLARAIDAQMRAAFSWGRLVRRMKAVILGVDDSALSLREALPFTISEVYLIHRDSGLLIWHTSLDPARTFNSEMVGAMLTAISDFAEQALGSNGDRHLSELSYDDQQILLSSGRLTYAAIVLEGVPPAEFRSDLNARIHTFEQAMRTQILAYDGEAEPFESVAAHTFSPLLTSSITDSSQDRYETTRQGVAT